MNKKIINKLCPNPDFLYDENTARNDMAYKFNENVNEYYIYQNN